MPEQVITDALRATSDELEIRWPVREEVQVLIRSAADEIDRLRAELVKAIRDSRASTRTAQYERGRAEGYEREIDSLVAAIENAPHYWKCRWDGVNVNDVCTCWKADAP